MATTEPLTGARIPDDDDAPLGGTAISRALQDIADETVPKFATSGARDTAYANWVATGKTMRDGLLCVVGTQLQMYRAGSWTASINVAALRAAGDLVADGIVSGTTLRATSIGDASATSTDHAWQVGPTGGLNLIADQNEIMGRNNGALSDVILHRPVAGTAQGTTPNALVRKDYIESRFSTYVVNWPGLTRAGTNNIPTSTITVPAQAGPYAVHISVGIEAAMVGGAAAVPSLELHVNGSMRGEFLFSEVSGTSRLFAAQVSRTIPINDGAATTIFARVDIPLNASVTTYTDDSHSYLTVMTAPL